MIKKNKMARRRYRRYRRYRKGLWSCRIQNVTGAQIAGDGTQYIINYTLCSNPAQNDASVSNKYTVKNINCQLQLESDAAFAVENLQAYICFVPQGYIPDSTPSAYANLPFNHPEWIMAHRFIGSAQFDNESTNAQPGFPALRLSSRLARKLDTGDRIVLIILGMNTGGSSVTLDYRGLVKYNTKAN